MHVLYSKYTVSRRVNKYFTLILPRSLGELPETLDPSARGLSLLAWLHVRGIDE